MTRGDRDAARRRMMFVAGEDFYFLAYTILITLNELDCRSSNGGYHDIDGLTYLADFISHEADLKLALTANPLSIEQKSRLTLLYDRSIARQAPFRRVLAALAERGFIELLGTNPTGAYLKADPKVLKIDSDIFEGERSRIAKLRKALRLKSAGRATVRTRLFTSHGVQTWDD